MNYLTIHKLNINHILDLKEPIASIIDAKNILFLIPDALPRLIDIFKYMIYAQTIMFCQERQMLLP